MIEIYPPGWFSPEDWDKWVQLRTPDVLAEGQGLDISKAFHKPFIDIDNRVMDVAANLMSVSEASDAFLDLWGSHLSEPRGGLLEDEYRLLLQGRLASQTNGYTVKGIIKVLQALTGTTNYEVYKLNLSSAVIEAQVDFTPTYEFQVRAGKVLQDCIDPAGSLSVILYRQSYAEFDSGLTGFGDEWAYDLFIMQHTY